VFDVGPSWYWMPEVFELFFAEFGYLSPDFYELKLLDPGFEVVFQNHPPLKVPAKTDELYSLFESIEQGSAKRLKKFMKEAENKYKIAIDKLLYLPNKSIFEYFRPEIVQMALQPGIFSPFSYHVRKYFSDPRLLSIMEFPILFLGATARQTPALYSMMNYAGLKLGTWYPVGGFGKVVNAMAGIAKENGTVFHLDAPVAEILTRGDNAIGIEVNGRVFRADGIIATADYSHVENMLPKSARNYPARYWEKKTFAPSCLIFYIGLSKKISGIQHHTLFLDETSDLHAREIYEHPRWPTKPQFYVCCPSKTDRSVAAAGHENLFFLMPLAPGLEDSEALREKYFMLMLRRLEQHTGELLENNIDYKKSYCVSDFVTDYNAYKGNAYGLSNILRQTGVLKPRMNSKRLKNFFYAGQLTIPGPGVPPAIISGKIAAGQLLTAFQKRQHETCV
jgi:phytoene desaturase